MRAAVKRLPATSPTLLPAAFLGTLGRAPDRPDTVRLGSGHRGGAPLPQADGSVLVLYAAPTTMGIATVACQGPIDAGGCEALASAVTVPGSRALEPSISTAFVMRLPAAVTDLDAARTKGMDKLAAATRSRGQALAADGLSRAHRSTAAALAPLTTEGDGLPTPPSAPPPPQAAHSGARERRARPLPAALRRRRPCRHQLRRRPAPHDDGGCRQGECRGPGHPGGGHTRGEPAARTVRRRPSRVLLALVALAALLGVATSSPVAQSR